MDIKKTIDRIFKLYRKEGVIDRFQVFFDIVCLLYFKSIGDFYEARKDSYLNAINYFKNYEFLKWSHFIALDPNLQYEFYNKNIYPFLAQQDLGKGIKKLKEIYNVEISSTTFLNIINEINNIFDICCGNRINKDNVRVYDEIYETLLSYIGKMPEWIKYKIPNHLQKLLCEMLDITLDDKVYTNKVMTGEILVAAYKRMEVTNVSKELQEDEDGFYMPSPKTDYLFPEEIRKCLILEGEGDEDNVVLRWISLMNFYFHQINYYQPQFEGLVSMIKKPESKYDKILGIYSKPQESANGIFNSILTKMSHDGKAAIIVPIRFLYSGKFNGIRKKILNQGFVDSVITLPENEFVLSSSLSHSAVIILSNSENKFSNSIWFCDLKNDGYSNDKRRIKTPDKPLPDLIGAFKIKAENQNVWFDSINVKVEDVLDNYNFLLPSLYVDSVEDDIEYSNPQGLLDEIDSLHKKIGAAIYDLRQILS